MYRTWCDENGFRNKKTLPGFIEELKRRFPQFISNDGIFRMEIDSPTSNDKTTATNFVSNMLDSSDVPLKELTNDQKEALDNLCA